MNLRFIILIFFLSLLASQAKADLFKDSEYLEYEVSYLSIKLGSVKLSVYNDNLNGIPVYKAKAVVDTYNGIPSLDLHSIINCFMDTSWQFSYKFTEAKKIDEKIWEYQSQLFDYKIGQVRNEVWRNKDLKSRNFLRSDKRWNDGLSLIYFTRFNCNRKQIITVPTYIFSDSASTFFKFYSKKQTAEIDAVNYPVKCIFLDGRALWNGIYGLTGYFCGWFSDDYARIPIKAKLNVYIGSVVIELKKWNKPGWNPPK